MRRTATGWSRITGRLGRLCWLMVVASVMGKTASLRIKTPSVCSRGRAPIIAARHTPCFWQEGWRTRVTTAVGDNPGQMLLCQKDSASLPARLPSEGCCSWRTKPLLTHHAGEETTPASCHTAACAHFPHPGAGGHIQQTGRRSAYALHSPHLLLNAFLV